MQHPPGMQQTQTSANLQIWSIWVFLPCTGYLSLFCKHWEISGKVALAGRIRYEGLFGTGFKFGNTNDYIPRKCELLKSYYIIHFGNTGVSILNTVFLFQGLELRFLIQLMIPEISKWKAFQLSHIKLFCGGVYHTKYDSQIREHEAKRQGKEIPLRKKY